MEPVLFRICRGRANFSMSDTTTRSNEDLFRSIPKMTVDDLAKMIKFYGSISSNLKTPPSIALFLGAGASVQSGIKLAGAMIEDLRERIIEKAGLADADEDAQNDWISGNVLNKPNDSEYSQYFSYYARDNKRLSHSYIQDLVRGKEPSLGYVIMASLIARNYINAVLTTNFDDLSYIACTKFTGLRPVVYAWGIMATELETADPRPKIVKLHGDFLFSKLANSDEDMEEAGRDKNMSERVGQILETFKMIVIGYSGNDRSVMKTLIEHKPSQEIYWCHRKGEIPARRVLELLYAKQGVLVEIEGFDEAMRKIYECTGFQFDALLSTFRERIEFIFKEIHKFDLNFSTNVLTSAIRDAKKQFKTKKDADFLRTFTYLNKGERAYKARDWEKAKKMYIRAIGEDPRLSAGHYCLGRVLQIRMYEFDEAKKYYSNAIAADPNDAYACNRLGYLISYTAPEEAEELIRNAIRNSPNYAYAYQNLGELLVRYEDRYDEAKQNFRRAIDIKPDLPAAYFRLSRLLEQIGTEQELDDLDTERQRNHVDLFEYLINSAVEYRERARRAERDKVAIYRNEAEIFIGRAKRDRRAKSYYDQARISGLGGESSEVIENLNKVLAQEDFEKLASAGSDRAFASIKNDPRFRKIVEIAAELLGRR